MSNSACFLSGCLIVKNEAPNLSRCLSSIAPFVDELVVVDTGSTDETIAIAEQFGASIHHFDWCDDFAAARNFAISQSHGEWILMPDADEELIVQKTDWSRQLSDNLDIQAFQINLSPPEESMTVFQIIRLFRNLPEITYEGRYHEHLTFGHEPFGNHSIGLLRDVQLTHYGYSPDILPQKSAQRIPMLERLRETEGLSLMLLWTLSGMYECTDQWEKSQGCYEEASERLFENLLMGEKPEDFRAVASWLYGLGKNCLNDEDFEGLRLICLRGLEWSPTFPPLSYLTGLMLVTFGFDLGAIPYFQQCVDFRESNVFMKGEPFDQNLLTVLPHYQLGCLYERLRDTQSAILHFSKSLEFAPDFSLALEKLKAIDSLVN